MSSDSGSDCNTRTRANLFITPGAGHQTTWICMGCHTSRSNLGAKGKGIRRRCAVCVAAKAVAKLNKDPV